MSREHPLLIAGHGRLPRVSLFGLLARWIGISVWGWARPESLPVPPLVEGSSPGPQAGAAVGSIAWGAAAGGSAARALAPVRPAARPHRLLTAFLLVLATAILVAGVIARSRLGAARDLLVTNPEHLSLLESAARLEEIAGRSLLVRLHPGSARRLLEGAGQIRAGRDRLLDAARTHRQSALALDSLGFAGRLVRGAEIVEPLRLELRRIDLPFLRGTLAFRELEEQSAPYEAVERAKAVTLKGTLAAAPPGHGLLIVPTGASGQEGAAVSLRQVGVSFELALDPEGSVRLTDVLNRGTATEVVEDIEVAATEWNERGFGFPRSGSFFRIRLDPNTEAAAPVLKPLSDAARDELAPLPADLR